MTTIDPPPVDPTIPDPDIGEIAQPRGVDVDPEASTTDDVDPEESVGRDDVDPETVVDDLAGD